MNAIEADNRSLKGVLPKNYANPELDKRVLGNVVDVFTNMDMSDLDASKDLLGRTYEYCIAQFASYEGVKGGEFYTPASVVKTIVSILKPTEGKLQDEKGFCAVVKTEDIAKQDYILTPGRYVGIEDAPEDTEPFDEKMNRLTTELGGMFAKSHQLEEEIKKNLEGIGWKI